jgi:hypothetical protein
MVICDGLFSIGLLGEIIGLLGKIGSTGFYCSYIWIFGDLEKIQGVF